MGSVTWRIWKSALVLVLTGYFPDSLLYLPGKPAAYILSPLLTWRQDSWEERKVPWEVVALKQEQIPMLLKLSLSWKEQSPFSNSEQLSRELPICLCLKNKSPCVLCGARHRSTEEAWITDWYRGGGTKKIPNKTWGVCLHLAQSGRARWRATGQCVPKNSLCWIKISWLLPGLPTPAGLQGWWHPFIESIV